jgi:hypothetical protein
MADFTTRPDSVNVEQIMEQIRSRIREKRGVDYTEQHVQELAAARLKELLQRRDINADLLDQFRKLQPAYEPPQLPRYEFEDSTLFESHRGPLRFIRKLLQPILKLFFNPNPLIQALNIQARLNDMYAEREAKRDAIRLASEQLHFEQLQALVVEMTRASLELKQLRMRIESIGGRLEFNERRTRTVESAVVYKLAPDEPKGPKPREQRQPPPAAPVAAPVLAEPMAQPAAAQPSGGRPDQPAEGGGQRRRRRRRRGRRGGGAAAPSPAGTPQSAPVESDLTDDAADTDDAVEVARDDLETISGAPAHPAEIEGVHASTAPSQPAAASDAERPVEEHAPAPPDARGPSDDSQ